MQAPRLSGLSTTCVYHSAARCQRYQGDAFSPRVQMTEGSQDTTEAKQLLQNFEEVLEQYIHRQFILDASAQG